MKNRTIFTGDNLEVMRGINSGAVDLVYLDPPFNSKKPWSAPVGSKAAGAHFKDTWTLSDIDERDHDVLRTTNPALHDVILAGAAAGGPSTMSYLMYMSVRLIELRRVLNPAGSLYLHCDPTESHSLKLMLDVIFGRGNFRNEIVWHYQAGTAGRKRFGRKHDIVLYYQAGPGATHNRVGKPVTNPERYDQVDDDGRRFLWGGNWDKALKRGSKKYYLDDGATCDDVWTWTQEPQFQQLNSQSNERVGYPTQKPLALMKRIIAASSNPGDLVLDPFCGCATACVAAELLDRRWVGIDLSEKAAELVDYRLRERLGFIQRYSSPHGHSPAHRLGETAEAGNLSAGTIRRAGRRL